MALVCLGEIQVLLNALQLNGSVLIRFKQNPHWFMLGHVLAWSLICFRDDLTCTFWA